MDMFVVFCDTCTICDDGVRHAFVLIAVGVDDELDPLLPQPVPEPPITFEALLDPADDDELDEDDEDEPDTDTTGFDDTVKLTKAFVNKLVPTTLAAEDETDEAEEEDPDEDDDEDVVGDCCINKF